MGHKIGIDCGICIKWREHGEYLYCKGCGRAVCIPCMNAYVEIESITVECPKCRTPFLEQII
jgi:hypothetical protein